MSQKVEEMKASTLTYGEGPRSWMMTIASLLPLWLWSVAIMVEGFPPPPIPIEIAIASFLLALVLSGLLLWKRWMAFELVVYSLFPFLLLSPFDEISTRYKTPFISLCAIVLTIGIVVYQGVRLARWQRGLILLAFAAVTYLLAGHAASSFWEMASDLGYSRCFPDAHGCAPLDNRASPWWVLFFSP
jgi:hypothetical protein